MGKAALAAPEAARGGEARQPATVPVERSQNGANCANRRKDGTGGSIRTCPESSQSLTG